jgi:hypothetical protein
MKFINEYRDAHTAQQYARAIERLTTQPWTIIEVCGGQTHAIVRFGVDELLPKAITRVHGPGCPVCVTPVEMIDTALDSAARPEVIFCSFNDMLRVPGTRADLLAVKAQGGDVRVVYSPLDALQVADRFHLLCNVRNALTTVRHSPCGPRPMTVAPPAGLPSMSAEPPVSPARQIKASAQPTSRKRAVWEAVQQRRGLGQSLPHIERTVGRDRRTVRRYLAMAQPPVYPPRRPRPTPLGPSRSYLAERWAQGCHHARHLSQELVPRGDQGPEGMVRMVVRPWRVRQESRPQPLTRSQLAWLLLQPAGRLRDADRNAVEGGRHAPPLLARGYHLKTGFHTRMAENDPSGLDQWLQEAETSSHPPSRT